MIAVLALAACRAEAAPAGVLVPAGWQELPELAAAVTSAAKPEATQAWGEPAMGCYAVAMTLKGSNTKGMLADVQKLAHVTDVVLPDGDGVMSLAFDHAPYRGRLHARIAAGTTAAVACFWNEREPVACEAACTQVIGSVR